MKRNLKRITSRERKYVEEVLRSQFRSRSGSAMTKRLELQFAKKFESNFAISFSNGTATMHATLEAMGVGANDEVIVPPLTMASTTFAVLHANATPVFADVDRSNFQISVDSVRSRISERTKAVIAVSLFGSSPDLERLRHLCEERGLFLIEDNAECYLSRIDGRLVGTFGHAASYSFQSSKHITSGEGGMIICQDEDLADRIRKVQSLGYAGVGAKTAKITKEEIQHPDYARHTSMGWNYRLGELNAAVALGQLERIDELVRSRVFAGEQFTQATAGFEEILRPQTTLPGHSHSFWTWAGLLNTDIVSWESFRAQFIANGGDSFYGAWRLTYMEPMMQNTNLLGREKFINPSILDTYKKGLCPEAEFVQPRMVQLRTNYWRKAQALYQAHVLRNTLEQISRGITSRADLPLQPKV